ncbi:hypothetical protein [Endozoicomonas sp.]|uniref:hypothetical protein n=1 Tax=Endozoicomonas sp. TaxID=1892382 RepID=UPI002886C103|nr:hypothetical protein [Endozoicomonas sp.]
MKNMIAMLIISTVSYASLDSDYNETCISHPATVVKSYDFSESGWRSGFADFPSGQEAFFELQSRAGTTYQDKDGNQHTGFMLSGINHSDDLFMFVKLPVSSDGLTEYTTYYAQFSVEFASNVASEGCAGIGGAPNGVTVKTGLTVEEPVASGSYMRLNIDKGNQIQGGKDVLVLGDIGSDSIDTCGCSPYAIVTRNSKEQLFSVTTDENKRLWLMLGFDSGFEGKTTLYLNKIKVVLTAVE